MIKQVILDVEGIAISGQLYLPSGKAPYSTVCVCHGIPASPPEQKKNGYPLLAEKICREGFAVLIFNFRGTGASGGNLDIIGWTRDLRAAIDHLWNLPEVDKSHLSLWGFSGGAAVSIYVAAQDSRISSVAACACPADFDFITEVDEPQAMIDHFRRIGTIRDRNFPESAEEWLNGFRLIRPIDHVAKIARRPLLLVHGDKDETVGVSHAHRLYEKAGEPKQIIIIESAGHRLRQDERTINIVIEWLKSQCGEC
jgi:fermentation-respiration switch protein FrsA (DUF1100 family)